MVVTVPQAAAEITHEACETLLRVARATPEDKLAWQPLENGRSILEQLAECTLANLKWARILRTRQYANLPRDFAEKLWSELTTLDAIAPRLREATQELIDALDAVPVEQLSDTIDTEWGPYSLSRCCFHAY